MVFSYVNTKTTIPVPHVHAFGRGEPLTKDRSELLTYLILDYVQGQSLDIQSFSKDTRERRDHFYTQLIDILAQLRQLEFSCGGSLIPASNDEVDPIVGPLLSIPINDLQIQRMNLSGLSTAFTSASDYILGQFRTIETAYQTPSRSEYSLDDVRQEVFAIKHFEEVLRDFVDSLEEDHTFVMSHLDLRWPNIIVDDELNIVGIIDWEWTGPIPRQLFMPPYWIISRGPQHVMGEEYRAEYSQFHRVLQANAGKSSAHRRLATEWDFQILSRLDLPIAAALLHHSELLPIFYRAIYPRLFKASSTEVVLEFFKDDNNRRLASEVQRRHDRSKEYTRYLKDNALFVPDEDARIARELTEKMEELDREFQEHKARKKARKVT
jgi:hypothetical protein